MHLISKILRELLSFKFNNELKYSVSHKRPETTKHLTLCLNVIETNRAGVFDQIRKGSG